MSKIEALTPEQEARFDEYVDKFTAAGYSTARADKDAAEDAAERAYLNGNLAQYAKKGEKPLAFPPKSARHWFPSPMAALKSAKSMSSKASANDFCYGHHDAGWVSRYAYFRDVVGLVEETDHIVPFIDMCFASGWWMPYDDRVLFCDRPETIHLDAEGNLHNPKGAALRYTDGFAVYAVRGVVVPDEWILKGPPSAKVALTWRNMEQRAAACEIVGWENILPQLDAQVIDEDQDPMIGTLLSCQLPDAEGRDMFLRVRCGTGRNFVIPVSRDTKTALDAQAKIWRLPQNIVRNFAKRT